MSNCPYQHLTTNYQRSPDILDPFRSTRIYINGMIYRWNVAFYRQRELRICRTLLVLDTFMFILATEVQQTSNKQQIELGKKVEVQTVMMHTGPGHP